MYVFCLSCPSATFALQRGGFVPREWLPAKGLFHEFFFLYVQVCEVPLLREMGS